MYANSENCHGLWVCRNSQLCIFWNKRHPTVHSRAYFVHSMHYPNCSLSPISGNERLWKVTNVCLGILSLTGDFTYKSVTLHFQQLCLNVNLRTAKRTKMVEGENDANDPTKGRERMRLNLMYQPRYCIKLIAAREMLNLRKVFLREKDKLDWRMSSLITK